MARQGLRCDAEDLSVDQRAHSVISEALQGHCAQCSSWAKETMLFSFQHTCWQSEGRPPCGIPTMAYSFTCIFHPSSKECRAVCLGAIPFILKRIFRWAGRDWDSDLDSKQTITSQLEYYDTVVLRSPS